METERLSERILSGLAQARRDGKQLGRPKGTVKQQEQLLSDYAGVVKDLKNGRTGAPAQYSANSRDTASLHRYGSAG